MSAVEARSALAAGVGSTKAPSKPQQGCIRRSGSTWTACTCADCRPLRERTRKLHIAGLLTRPDYDRANRTLEHWLHLGWQPSAIGSAMGLSTQAAWQIVYRRRNGAEQLQDATVRRILTAGEPTTGRVGTTGTRRRLQALARMGWSLDDVHERVDASVMSLHRTRTGVAAAINVTAHNAIRDLYARVQDQPGPSPQAAHHARTHKWAPPAAWDDDTIDDPDTEPEGLIGPRGEGQGRPAATDDTVIARVRDLVRAGLSDAEIGRDVGRTRAAVEKLRNRHGIRRAA